MRASRELVVSLHDVHPASLHQVRAQRKTLSLMGVDCFSHLVVPWWHGRQKLSESPDLLAWLRRRLEAGDELVQHGWRHDCEGLPPASGDWFWRGFYTSAESEFRALGTEEASRRLRLGREEWDRANLPAASGFIAPAWLLGTHERGAVRAASFRYTVDVNRVDFWTGSAAGRSLCWSVRSAARRLLSPLWNRILLKQRLSDLALRGGLLRISLHPADLQHAGVRKSVLSSIQQALAAGCQPTTYAAIAARAQLGPASAPS